MENRVLSWLLILFFGFHCCSAINNSCNSVSQEVSALPQANQLQGLRATPKLSDVGNRREEESEEKVSHKGSGVGGHGGGRGEGRAAGNGGNTPEVLRRPPLGHKNCAAASILVQQASSPFSVIFLRVNTCVLFLFLNFF